VKNDDSLNENFFLLLPFRVTELSCWMHTKEAGNIIATAVAVDYNFLIDTIAPINTIHSFNSSLSSSIPMVSCLLIFIEIETI